MYIGAYTNTCVYIYRYIHIAGYYIACIYVHTFGYLGIYKHTNTNIIYDKR